MKVAIFFVVMVLTTCGASNEHEIINYDNLEWIVVPWSEDGTSTWDDADNWIRSLGNGWRMPSLAELNHLYALGINSRDWGVFEELGTLTIICSWSTVTPSRNNRYGFCFSRGSMVSILHNTRSVQALAVRTPD